MAGVSPNILPTEKAMTATTTPQCATDANDVFFIAPRERASLPTSQRCPPVYVTLSTGERNTLLIRTELKVMTSGAPSV